MQSTIVIRETNKQIKVNFTYNIDLVEIMRKHNGYFFRKEKAWCFPKYKSDDIKKELQENKYTIKIKKEEEPEKPKTIQKKIDVFADPDTIAVYGKCKSCKEGGFVDKNGLCVKCK